MPVTSVTYLEDAKMVYGAMRDQMNTQAMLINLMGDGSKIGQPVTNPGGLRGWTFNARLRPNFYMGFRPESATVGVGLAGAQIMHQATVNLKWAYVPVTITGQAENLTKGNEKAFMQAKALEAKFDMKDIVKHVNVLVAGAEPGGQLAQVAAAPAPGAGTFYADDAGYLPAAIYLRVGMPIDTGAVGGGALTCTSSVITAINYATRLVTHTLGTAVAGEAVTLGGEHAIAVAPVFPYTCDGLVSLVSDVGAVHGLNPATANQESWASYVEDVAGADLSSQYLDQLCRFVQNRGGENVDTLVFPSAQMNMLTSIATQNLRFDVPTGSATQKKAIDLGFTTASYAGRTIVEEPDARPQHIFAFATGAMKKFEALPLALAEDEAGSWTRIYTATGIADAVAGLLRWYFNIGIEKRSAAGVMRGFSVPAAFQLQPSVI